MSYLPLALPLVRLWLLVVAAVLAWPQAVLAQAAARNAEPLVSSADSVPPKPRRVWSVAIGVSDYQYSDRGISDLQYAAADARAFDQMVAEKHFVGGGVPAEQRILLTDKDATLANVRSALLDFLGKAGKDDMVVVLFAGHGAPDPLRPSELYLLVADTDPQKLASTALPMTDVRHAFERLHSDHVVFFADACHSAGIVLPGAQVRALDEGNRIHNVLAELGKIQRNRVVVTSSGADEKSFEGRKWQHGVFTWALLQAVAGKADSNGDGIVQLGEAVEYMRDIVERETGFAQHPAVVGQFDGRLPLAAAAEVAVSKAQGKMGEPALASTEPPKGPHKTSKLKVLPASKRSMVIYNFSDFMVEARRWRPDVAVVIAPPNSAIAVPAAEVARLGQPAQQALSAWQQAQTGLLEPQRQVREAEDQLAAKRAEFERQFAWPAKATTEEGRARAAEREKYCNAELQLLAKAQSRRGVAVAQWRERATELRDILAAELARDPSVLTGLPPALWVVLAAVDASLRNHEFDNMPEPTPPNLPAPQRYPDMQRPLAVLDAFLDRFRVHPLRPVALYYRAYLACELGNLPPLAVAQQYLRVVAEVPDHPLAAELHLRIGMAYFEALDPRVQSVARAELLAALDRAPPGHPRRAAALHMAAWVATRMDRRDQAMAYALTLLAEFGREQKLAAIVREARELAASFVFEDGQPAPVLQSPLPSPEKAVILGMAADQARSAGDFELGVDLADRALALDPDSAQAQAWEVVAADCEAGARNFAAAAARLDGLYAKYGAASPWYAKHREALPPDLVGDLTKASERAVVLRARAEKAAQGPQLPLPPSETCRPLPRRMDWMWGLCYGQARSAGRSPQGRFTLKLTFFDDQGLAAVESAGDATGDAELVACIIRRAKGLRRPPKANAVLEIPLIFGSD